MSFVNTKKGFSRKYLIFINEDAGYESGGKPSGYVKLEVRDGKGMLNSVIHNVRPGSDVFEYVLYLVRSRLDGHPVLKLRTEAFRTENGKAELEWPFDPFNVGESGLAINKFDVFAVVVEYAGELCQDEQDMRKTAGGIICPLAAYANKPVDWREFFNAEGQGARLRRKGAIAGMRDFNQGQGTYREQFDIPMGPGNMEQNQPDMQPKPQHAEPEPQNGQPGQQDLAAERRDTRQAQQDAWQERNEEAGGYEKQPEQQDTHSGKHFPNHAHPKTPTGTQSGGGPAGGPSKVNTNCVYYSGNFCGAHTGNMAGDDPCGSCIFQNRERTVETQPHGDIARLKSDLEKCFETSDPFHSQRSDYTWWKVTDPVNLNNILYRNGIRAPLMFNPAVMMSYYRYRHLIIGIFTHRTGQSFVVCGVPGMHLVDGKPFGEMGKWVQAEGNKPRYGSFGYWLAYINPTDGKILEI